MNYRDVKLVMVLYITTALVYFNRFIVFFDSALKSACNITHAARFWSLDILSRFDEEVVPQTTDPYHLRAKHILGKTFFNIS